MQRDLGNFTLSAIAPALLAMMLIAGCTPDSARWTPAEAPKENKIEFIVMSHPVNFETGAVTPAASEAQGLSNFLNTTTLGYGDQVTIDAGPHGSNAAADALAAKRLNAVSDMLRKLHVRAQPASRPTVDGALNRNTVIVSVGRYIATGPNCPDRSKTEADDYTNTTESNYGCATATNLGLMVANPGDLIHGAPAGPADGTFSALGVQSYRADTLTKTIKSELSGGGGN